MTSDTHVRDVTDAEIQTYRTHGVAHLPALVDSAICRRLLAAADERRASPGLHSSALSADGKFWEERESYRHNAAMADLVLHSGLARQAGRVMDAREVRFYFDHLFMLREDTAKDQYYWHQDMPYWACDGAQLCSFWLALTDCSLDSGALEFVLGTDTGRLYEPVPFAQDEDVAPPPPDALPPRYEAERERWTIVSWDIKAGDALLFNGRIMHSSRGNHSKTQRRVAYSTRWIGEDMRFCRRPGGFLDPVTLPPEGVEWGEPLSSSARYPLLWRAE